MRNTLLVLSTLLLLPAAMPQERQGAKKVLTFPEAVEAATKAVDAEKTGAAIAALQAAIKDLQKKQRAQILACMPKPDGWEIEDSPEDSGNDLTIGMLGGHATVTRTYRSGDKHVNAEVTANSPLLQAFTMMFANPALVEADGGEIVKYGPHKAILKKNGDNGQELTILMHDAHLVKASAQGVSIDDLLKMFDQEFVNRLEKPLGK